MQTSPRKTAVLILLTLLLLGALAWWWQSQAPAEQPAAAPAKPGAAKMPEGSMLAAAQAFLRKKYPGLDVAALQRDVEACEAQTEAVTRERWEALGRSSALDDRVVHALLADLQNRTPGEPVTGGESSRLLGVLVEEVPDDVDLLWFRTAHCSEGCDRRAAKERLTQAEPDNLATWLSLLSEVSSDDSVAANDPVVDALLERAAQSRYYEQRYVDTLLRIYQAYQGMPVPPACNTRGMRMARNVMRDMGMHGLSESMESDEIALTLATTGMALSLPSSGGLYRLCRAENGLSPARLASCRAILTKMAEGEALLDHGIALGTMVRLTEGMPADEADRWRERYRQFRWLLHQQTEMAYSFDTKKAFDRMVGGEARMLQAELQAAGRWPPPADWQPDGE